MTDQNQNTASARQDGQPPKLNTSTDAAAPLEESLASPVEPTSARAAADAKRAMSVTDAWKPALDRRQSWDNQEYKRELQMSSIDEVKTGPGFSEK